MANPLEFYFDFASPYGYLASLEIDALAARHGRAVVWRPILLGAVFKVTGMKPNMQQPLRGDYLKHDIQRLARRRGLPLVLPASMPMNGLAAARAFYWLEQNRDRDAAVALARAVYHAHWIEGRDLAAAAAVAEIAGGLGFDAAAVLAGLELPASK